MNTSLSFVKEFTKGNLKGLRHESKLDFVDILSADKWLAGIQRNTQNGSLDYRIVAYRMMEVR